MSYLQSSHSLLVSRLLGSSRSCSAHPGLPTPATPSLLTGVYGFDEAYDYCWYATENVSADTLTVRIIVTWSLWLFIAVGYLVVAVTLITYALGSTRGPLTDRGMSEYLTRHPPHAHATADDTRTALAALMARRDVARRALTVRVLGYMLVPVLCVLPGVVSDIITRARPDVAVPPAVELVAAVAAGLMGTLNTLLICFDPSVVSVVFWPFWRARRDRRRGRARARSRSMQRDGPADELPPPPSKDPEMGETLASSYGNQETVITTVQNDHDLEFFGHLAVNPALDSATTVTSTIGYDAEALAEIFHGL